MVRGEVGGEHYVWKKGLSSSSAVPSARQPTTGHLPEKRTSPHETDETTNHPYHGYHSSPRPTKARHGRGLMTSTYRPV